MLALLCGPAHAQDAPAAETDATAQFAAAWKQVASSAPGWAMQVSPVFPQHWPPGSGDAVVRYAFAYRLSERIADGAEMAAPWARGDGNLAGPLRVELLRRSLEPIGIQGVRPMQPWEIQLASRQEEAGALLLRPLNTATDGLIRAFYCNWKARQGTVAATIAPRHPGFFRWLECR